MPPWLNSLEPNAGNIRQWMDNVSAKLRPMENARWNQANIATNFYAGNQSFVNNMMGGGFGNNTQNRQYYFNICQVPVNFVTGYQRQHRKNFNYIPHEGSDPKTTDQYNRLMTNVCNQGSIHEQFSRGCEQAAITGLIFAQPYLDYTSDDPAQGSLKLKIWEFNSFLVDPYARDPLFKDAQMIWCQEFISKDEALARFGDKANKITPMSGNPQRYSSFYFLPENHNLARNDLMVVSYIWYKTQKKRKRLYSPRRNQFYEFAGGEGQLDVILDSIPDLEVVEIEVPVYQLATVLNDQLMYQGDNPLGYDDFPMVPIYWNNDPHMSNNYDLRVRGLIYPMLSPQYLFNRRIILNHDITEATINAGWKRKIGAVANEDNLKKSGQGWDIIINEGYELIDCEKIVPSGVPESDLALAEQLKELTFSVTGFPLENWSAQDDSQASSLTVMMKQAANLMVYQKYFDQWDLSLKYLGDLNLKIVLNNWNASKVEMLIGEEPTDHFYSKIFAKYMVTVEEGILTPTQQNMQAKQMLDINQIYGREVFPPSKVIQLMNIAEKANTLEFLQQQEQQAAAVQGEAQNIQHAFEEAKLKEMMSKSVNNIASAKERYGRYESDLGLKDERESELTKNRALATKAKMEALEKMVDVTAKLGAIETMVKLGQIDEMQDQDIVKEDAETNKSQNEAMQNEFMSKILSDIPGTVSNQIPGQQNQI